MKKDLTILILAVLAIGGFLFLKDKRNEEAHELSVKFSKNDKYIAFLAGIEIIYKLNGIKRAA